jgi:hypothetical protein
VEVLYSKEDLGCVELGSFFSEFLAFAEMGEHLSSSDEVHHEEDFLLGLEGEF